MRDTDYKLFNRMMAAAVLASGIFYMPILRRRLMTDFDGAYDWVDSPMNDSAVKALEIFDSFMLFSAALVLLAAAAIFILRRRKKVKTVHAIAAAAVVYVLCCAAFAVINGVGAVLLPYLIEQAFCSAALSAAIFLFPKK